MAEGCSFGMYLLFSNSRSTSSDLKLPVVSRLQFEIVYSLPEEQLSAPMGSSRPPPLSKVFGCRRNGSSMETSQPFILSTCLSVYTAYSNSFVLCFFLSVRLPLLLTGRPAGGLTENHTHSNVWSSEGGGGKQDFTQGLSITAWRRMEEMR
jgi:hypothetical protein